MHINRRDLIKSCTAFGVYFSVGSSGLMLATNTSEADIKMLDDNPLFRLKPLQGQRGKVGNAIDGFFWLDAKWFEDYGGWQVDSFHTDLAAASSYLIANRIQPGGVADAITTLTIPESGIYYLWVRTRNWLTKDSPGQFKVIINGNDNGCVYGCSDSDKWVWESGGSFELEKGITSIRLNDLTGHLSRVDAIILTRDANYKPPDKREDYLKEKHRLAGIPEEPEKCGKFDVVVVGAGPAGIPAAVAAARRGCRVALVHDRPVLGGNASFELGVPLNGSTEYKTFTRETGILEDIRAVRSCVAGDNMQKGFSYTSEVIVHKEKNIKLFLNENIYDTQTSDDVIRKVYSRNTLTDRLSEFEADLFIDCTGDGWLGYYAGAEYRLGREARSEFNESLAPEKESKVTMSGSLMSGWKDGLFYYAAKADEPIDFDAPQWAVRIPDPKSFFENRKWDERFFHRGSWWIEYPGETDDLYDEEQARDYLYRITVGFWDMMKNRSQYSQQAANWQLLDVPHNLGKRESRRLVGDYILNQNDVEQAKLFEDRVAYAGWPIDIHHAKGVFADHPLQNPKKKLPVNHIPYRCLYSKNVRNLFMAGRNSSVTAMALGTVRVQCTCGMMGQAVGTAAAICVEKEILPRDIYNDHHLSYLQQQLLKDDHYLYGIENQDTDDLARAASVTASSVRNHDTSASNVINGITRPFDGKPNRWESGEGLGNGEFIVLEFPQPAEINCIQCIFDTDLHETWSRGVRPAEKLVKKYDISCFDGESWVVVASEDDNYFRLRRHKFNAIRVQKVKVTVYQTHGHPCASIYEIRAYNQTKDVCKDFKSKFEIEMKNSY